MKQTPKANKRTLIDIDLPAAAKPKKGKLVQTLTVQGDQVTRFTEALRQVKSAQAVINELKPDLIQAGLEFVFEQNVANSGDTKALISSVKLADAERPDTEVVEQVMVSYQRKDTAMDPEAVNGLLTGMVRKDGKVANVNDYVEYGVAASFDVKIFNDENGNFDMGRYKKVAAALADVAEELGAPSPLACGKVMRTKGDWHERRWRDFDAHQNLLIQAVIPAVVSLKAVETVDGEGE